MTAPKSPQAATAPPIASVTRAENVRTTMAIDTRLIAGSVISSAPIAPLPTPQLCSPTAVPMGRRLELGRAAPRRGRGRLRSRASAITSTPMAAPRARS